jgi:hypothetical protein
MVGWWNIKCCRNFGQIMTSIIKKDDVVWDNKLILAYGFKIKEMKNS